LPNDSFGVKKIYPDSTVNPQSFYISDDDPRRELVGGGIISRNSSTQVYTIENPGPNVVLQIYTTAGYRSSSIEKDHGKAASKGYMMTAKDWRNVEMTMYVRVDSSTSTKGISMICRGGATTNKSQGNCEACGYLAYLGYQGSSVFGKIEHYGSVNYTTANSATSDLEGRWIGFKFVCYNKADTGGGAAVALEIWIDENESNSWRRIQNWTDNGNWGNSGKACGGVADQILSFGGPVASFVISAAQFVKFKKLSVREISAEGVFNEGGSNAGGGQQNGGTGSTGSGSTGGSTNNGTGGVSRCTSPNTKSNTSTNTKAGSNLDSDNPTDTSGSTTNSSPASTSTNNNSNTGAGGGNVDKFGVVSLCPWTDKV